MYFLWMCNMKNYIYLLLKIPDFLGNKKQFNLYVYWSEQCNPQLTGKNFIITNKKTAMFVARASC